MFHDGYVGFSFLLAFLAFLAAGEWFWFKFKELKKKNLPCRATKIAYIILAVGQISLLLFMAVWLYKYTGLHLGDLI